MNRIQRLLMLFVIALVAIGAFNVNAAKAITTWTYVDNMDSTGQSFWNCDKQASLYSNCQFFTSGHSWPIHSLDGAWLMQTTGTAGSWTGLGRHVTVTNRYGVVHSCTASFWLNNADTDGQTVGGNVEVIDPATWTYISLKTYSLGGHSGWIHVFTNSWTASAGQDVYVRVTNATFSPYDNRKDLMVDDMNVTCSVG